MDAILTVVLIAVLFFFGFACGSVGSDIKWEDKAVRHGCAAYHLEGKTAVFKWNDEASK